MDTLRIERLDADGFGVTADGDVLGDLSHERAGQGVLLEDVAAPLDDPVLTPLLDDSVRREEGAYTGRSEAQVVPGEKPQVTLFAAPGAVCFRDLYTVEVDVGVAACREAGLLELPAPLEPGGVAWHEDESGLFLALHGAPDPEEVGIHSRAGRPDPLAV